MRTTIYRRATVNGEPVVEALGFVSADEAANPLADRAHPLPGEEGLWVVESHGNPLFDFPDDGVQSEALDANGNVWRDEKFRTVIQTVYPPESTFWTPYEIPLRDGVVLIEDDDLWAKLTAEEEVVIREDA